MHEDPRALPVAPLGAIHPPAEGVVLHYGEIGLKGGNRRQFERRLGDRLREGLSNAALPGKVVALGGRFLAVVGPGAPAGRALEVLTRIPGVAHAANARLVEPTLERIAEAAVPLLATQPPGSFKVESKRADKSFPATSIDVSRHVGAACARASGRPVDVHAPDVTVRVEVLPGRAVVSTGERPGPGGLPVGSSGRLLALLSGGLDSPVAAWMMLRRGAHVTAVHFWNRSMGAQAVLEKIEDLGRILAWAAGELRLVVIPFEACQRAIVATVPPDVRMLVYRRAMLRIAAALAREERALGIVTGDSLGQVASQTAENLRAVQAVLAREPFPLPIYTPLIGSDKVEIVERARRIGTYDVSIRPHDDCCSFLNAPHPETRARPADLERHEAPLPWDQLVADALAGAQRSALRPVSAS
jgi:thiamine biosynthesis protein ThiI